MIISDEELQLIKEMQSRYTNFVLSGSVALIASGALDNRPVSDIDIVLHKRCLPKFTMFSNLKIDKNYPDSGDGYISYHATYKEMEINLLVYNNDREIRNTWTDVPNIGKIKHQKLEDIINWKKKYNRPKDLKDLENITNKALEKAVFGENV